MKAFATKHDRDAKVLALNRDGLTVAEIAASTKVSASTIRNILADAAVKTNPGKRVSPFREDKRNAEIVEEAAKPGACLAHIARMHGISRQRVGQILEESRI